MARNRDFKAEYARRIERSLAKGKTRQQARGHKAHEHVERREREREKYGLTSAETKVIRKWYQWFNGKDYRDVPTEEGLIEFSQEKGYAAFQRYRKVWDAVRRQYLKDRANGQYASKGLPHLEYLTDLAGVRPPGTIEWLYYH